MVVVVVVVVVVEIVVIERLQFGFFCESGSS